MYASKPGLGSLFFKHNDVSLFNRLYGKFTMETTVATAFGQRVEVQKGEASELVDAVVQFVSSFKDEKSFGLPEVILILCKTTNYVYMRSKFEVKGF